MRHTLAWCVIGLGAFGIDALRADHGNELGASPTALTRPVTTTISKHSLSLDGAMSALRAAAEAAARRGAGPSIAVVDDGGYLLCFQRADGSFAAGAEVSIGKARTAAIFKKPTAAFEDSINGGRYALLDATNFTPLRGGVPIVIDGEIVGAIGVSGAASAQEDEEIAAAGAAFMSAAATRAVNESK